MIKILVNDGIEESGKKQLLEAGFEVDMNKIPQEELMSKLNNYEAICVRSATKVRKELIDACPNLKVIARGGVGLDNIDVEYAKSKGIYVVNTPAASSRSVAELAFAHLLGISRFLHKSNKQMPLNGSTTFNDLKKNYAAGVELDGKTLGVIGMGRIGQEAIKIGIGMGMKIVAHDPFVTKVNITFGSTQFNTTVEVISSTMDVLLSSSDYITIHVPGLDKPVLSAAEFFKMKKGVYIANCARGGVIDEEALLDALNDGTVAAAGLDVFVGEPSPRAEILSHPNISLTPHIGASTAEAQEKIGSELASQLISILS